MLCFRMLSMLNQEGSIRISSRGAFLKAWLTNPGRVGAVCPSSPGLARKMASFVPFQPEGLVVELGPGTGVVTSALLQKGVPRDQLVLIEYSPTMVEYLKEKFPYLLIIQGDASCMTDLLKAHLSGAWKRVEAVVSSLPLRSLPPETVHAIMGQLDLLLDPESSYIQFTYDLRPGIPSAMKKFKRRDFKIAWWNIPPARVDHFRRNS